MAIMNINTPNLPIECLQNAAIGTNISFDPSDHDKIALILRVLIALSEDDTPVLVAEGEPYELLVRRLTQHHLQISEIAEFAKEVVINV